MIVAGVATASLFWLAPAAISQETKTNSTAAVPAPSVVSSAPKPTTPGNAASANAVKKAKPAPKTLTGAEVYSMHCFRCHPERYPNERTAAQWKTIALHMRVRANLPAEHVRILLKYLQDNSGYGY